MTNFVPKMGKWRVQTGKGKGKYKETYTFESTEKFRAIKWYEDIHVHTGGKKRLIDPNGNVHLRTIT